MNALLHSPLAFDTGETHPWFEADRDQTLLAGVVWQRLEGEVLPDDSVTLWRGKTVPQR